MSAHKSTHTHASSRRTNDVGETTAPELPPTKGDGPLPEELTGRASGTREDLISLFANSSSEHLSDGFRGGTDDDPETDIPHADA